ncbi:MAG: GntR family transcriptional regulator [Terriglobales bacterium]
MKSKPKVVPRTQSSRLRQSLRSTLLRWIVAGRLEAGKPVNESKLATQLKVSRTPLREALLQLEQEGFIRSDERRGFSVERLSAREIREIYPMIWTLEGLAVRSSAVCAHLLVQGLARLNSEFAKTRNPQRALDLDTQWHEQLTSQSQNRRLRETISALRLGVRRYETVYMADTRLLSESVAQHNAIIDALKKHDIVAAMKGIKENWRFAMEVLIRKMGEE